MKVEVKMLTENDIQEFVTNAVSLKQGKAQEYRKQARRLRERLEERIREDPEFGLHKMLLSGSVAKGTALSTLNDMDNAVYLVPEAVSEREINLVLEYVEACLIDLYSGWLERDQFSIGKHAVRVSFRGSGLDVEVVPIIPNGKPDDRGNLATAGSTEWIETSIPLHLKFIRSRKEKHSKYASLVRLAKWWKREHDVPLKSFQIELLWAKLVDEDAIPSTYDEALLRFFGFIVSTELKNRVAFSDYYEPSELPQENTDPVNIYDPVNPCNNVASNVTETKRVLIVRQAQEALNMTAMASCAHTKGRAVECWQQVFGSSFNV